MSSCLILQAKDKLYIGADTSSSVFIDDKLYRLNNNTKKLFLLNDNTVLYCAGNNSIAEKVVQHISSIYCRNDFSLISLKNWLIEMYPYENKDKTVYDVEILIATFKNNKTIVYQMSQYKNYDIISFDICDTGVQILSAGIKNAECMSFAENELLNKSGVKTIFRTTFNNLSCNYIGGCLDLYEITKNGAVKIFDSERINEHGIQYVHDVFNDLSVSLNAEVLVSKLVMSENLWIENDSGTYKFDDAGFIASSGKNSVRIQPNQSGELFSIYKGNNRQVYINSDGDVQFSGLVSGGSININNKFMVDKNGNVTAKSGSFSCDITGSSGTFGGVTIDSNGLSSNQFSIDAYGNASFSGTLSAASITSSGALNDYLTSSDLGASGTTSIDGGRITTGTISADRIDVDNLVVKNGNFTKSFNVEIPISGSKNFVIRAQSDDLCFIGREEYAIDLGGNLIYGIYFKGHKAYYAGNSTTGEIAIKDDIPDTSSFAPANHSHGNYVSNVSVSSSSSTGTKFVHDASIIGNTMYLTRYVYSASDIRLKQNVTDLPDLTQIYMQLEPKKFKYSDVLKGYSKDWKFGLIAQDMERLFYEANIPIEETGLITLEQSDSVFNEDKLVGDDVVHRINYDQFHAMHIQMIQKQQKEIEELKQEIEKLKELINR